MKYYWWTMFILGAWGIAPVAARAARTPAKTPAPAPALVKTPAKNPAPALVKTPAKNPAPVTRLCAHAVEKDGVLTCAHPVTADVARRRQYVYRFTEQGGRVLKVEVINSTGKLFVDLVPEPALLRTGSVEYRWNPDGSGFWATFLLRDGSTDVRWKVAKRTRDKYRAPAPGETDPETARVQGNGPCREKWTVDSKGFVKTLRFFNWKDEPRPDDDEVYGYEYERDAAGLVVAQVPLDRTGKRTKCPDGQAKLTIQWDARGNLLGFGAVDGAGQPAKPIEYYVPKSTYDEVGNRTGVAYLDRDGKPVRNYEGIYGLKGTFDAAGNLVERRFCDAAGNPGLSESGSAGERFTFDEQGRETGQCHLGADGQPAADPKGVICEKRTLNEKGWVTELRYLDAQGRPKARKDQVGLIRSKSSDDGLRLEDWFFDVAGKPVLNEDGVHGDVFITEVTGLKTERCTYGKDGKKKANRHKVACNKTTYNQDGRILEDWYFDAQDRLVLNEDGIAGNVVKYDEFNRLVEDWYFGTRKELVMHPEMKYAGAVTTYDAEGNLDSMIEYDAARKLIHDPEKTPEAEPEPDGLTEEERTNLDPDQLGE